MKHPNFLQKFIFVVFGAILSGQNYAASSDEILSEVGNTVAEIRNRLKAVSLRAAFPETFQSENYAVLNYFGVTEKSRALDLYRPLVGKILQHASPTGRFMYYDAESMVWVGQRQAFLLTPDSPYRFIFTEGSHPCYTITVFNKNKPGYALMLHADNLFEYSSLGDSVKRSELSLHGDDASDRWEIHLLVNEWAPQDVARYEPFYGPSQEELLGNIQRKISGSLHGAEVRVIKIPYNPTPEVRRLREAFVYLMSSIPMNHFGRWKIQENQFFKHQMVKIFKDTFKAWVINKDTGEISQTNLAVTRPMLPNSAPAFLDALYQMRQECRSATLNPENHHKYSLEKALDHFYGYHSVRVLRSFE